AMEPDRLDADRNFPIYGGYRPLHAYRPALLGYFLLLRSKGAAGGGGEHGVRAGSVRRRGAGAGRALFQRTVVGRVLRPVRYRALGGAAVSGRGVARDPQSAIRNPQ